MTLPTLLDRGQGHALVCAHGTLMDRTMFAPQAEALADVCRIIAYDSRARAERNATSYGLDDLVADCVALLDALAVDRCVLMGMSMGGYMAIEFALRHPERLDGLVLIGTMAGAYTPAEQAAFGAAFSRLDTDGTVPREFAEWAAPLCFGATTCNANPALVQAWVDRWCRLPARSVYREAFSWIGKPDRVPDLARIRCPVLIVHGEEDAVLPLPRCARPMAAGLPNGVLRAIPRAGHSVNLEQPEPVNAAIREFLGTLKFTGR